MRCLRRAAPRETSPSGLQHAADLDEHAGQIVDGLQGKTRRPRDRARPPAKGSASSSATTRSACGAAIAGEPMRGIVDRVDGDHGSDAAGAGERRAHRGGRRADIAQRSRTGAARPPDARRNRRRRDRSKMSRARAEDRARRRARNSIRSKMSGGAMLAVIAPAAFQWSKRRYAGAMSALRNAATPSEGARRPVLGRLRHPRRSRDRRHSARYCPAAALRVLPRPARQVPAGCARDAGRASSFIAPPYCERLGIPFAYDPGPGVLSLEAIADPPSYGRARAAVLFDDIARDLVHRLKFGDRLDLAAMMGRWMARAGET